MSLTMTSLCGIRGGYAEWDCRLDSGHEGNHRDGIGREWDNDSVGVTPVIDPDKITERHATRIAEDMDVDFDSGTIEIEGVKVAWESDDESIWFFNPGDTSTNSIKTFGWSRELSVWAQ